MLDCLVSCLPCNIHVTHNAFRAGINTYGEATEELAIDLSYWLKNSPARRENYINVLNEVGHDEELFIRHVQCRWLTLLPALERIEKKWEVIKKYFLLSKQQLKCLEKNDRYRRICRKLEDDKFLAQVAFFMSG